MERTQSGLNQLKQYRIKRALIAKGFIEVPASQLLQAKQFTVIERKSADASSLSQSEYEIQWRVA